MQLDSLLGVPELRASLDTAQDEKSCEPHAFFPLRGSHPGKKVLILGIRKKARFVDHLGERRVRNAEVDGSIPLSSTKKKACSFKDYKLFLHHFSGLFFLTADL